MANANYIAHKFTGTFVSVKPIILPELNLLVYVDKNSICVYDLQKTEIVFSFNKHTKEICSLLHVPESRSDIISCSFDGQIFLWNVNDGFVHKEISIQKNVRQILQFNHENQSIYCVYRLKKKIIMGVYSIEDESFSKIIEAIWSEFSIYSVMGGSNENAFAAILAEDSIIVWSPVSNKQTVFKADNVICLAAHPSEAVLAVSYSNLKIEVWWNALATKYVNIKKITLRWHVHPVYCMSFTSTGCHLLTGGKECVMVRWDLSQGSHVDNKQFMARLGAPVKNISCSIEDENYVISLASNTMLIVDSATLTIENRVGGLVINPHSKEVDPSEVFPCGLSIHPITNTLLINSLPGSLQHYDPITMFNAGNVDVTRQNFVTPLGDRKPVYNEVYSACISNSGHWLVTYSHLNSNHEGSDTEAQLIFWICGPEKKFQLLHNFEMALSAPVTAMSFRPRLPTAGNSDSNNETELAIGLNDGCVMLWRVMKHEASLSLDKSNPIAKCGMYWSLNRHWFLRNIPLKSVQTDSTCPLLLEFSAVSDALSTMNQCLMLARGNLLFCVSWKDLDRGVFSPVCQTTLSAGFHCNQLKLSKHLHKITSDENCRVMYALRLITSECDSVSGKSSMTVWEVKHARNSSHNQSWSVRPVTSSPLRVTAVAVHPESDLVAVCHTPLSVGETLEEEEEDKEKEEVEDVSGKPQIFIFHASEKHPIYPVNSFFISESHSSLIWYLNEGLLGLHVSSSPQLYFYETEELQARRLNLSAKKKEEKQLKKSSKLPVGIQLASSDTKTEATTNLIPGLDVETKLTDYRRDLDQKWEQLSRYPAYTAPAPQVLLKELLTFDLKSYLKSKSSRSKLKEVEQFQLHSKDEFSTEVVSGQVPQDNDHENIDSRNPNNSFYIADFDNLVLSATDDYNNIIQRLIKKSKQHGQTCTSDKTESDDIYIASHVNVEKALKSFSHDSSCSLDLDSAVYVPDSQDSTTVVSQILPNSSVDQHVIVPCTQAQLTMDVD